MGRRRPADHHGSSSRTSSRGSAAGRRWSRPGSPGSTRSSTLHDARRIGDPAATWGPVEDNPVHRDIRACAAALPAAPRARRAPRPAQRIPMCTPVSCSPCTPRAARDRAGGRRCARCPTCSTWSSPRFGPSAGPEPLPGGQGDGRGRARRAARGRMVIRPSAPNGYRARLVRAGMSGRPARRRAAGADRLAGPDQWQVQVLARCCSARRRAVLRRFFLRDEVRAEGLTARRGTDRRTSRRARARGSAVFKEQQTIHTSLPRTRQPVWRDGSTSRSDQLHRAQHGTPTGSISHRHGHSVHRRAHAREAVQDLRARHRTQRAATDPLEELSDFTRVEHRADRSSAR